MKANEFLHKKDVAYMNRLSVSLDFNAIVSLMEEYAALRQPLVSGSLPLNDFISEVERMQKLYSNSKYTIAEELRDKLAEQLDDIMRLGGNDR